MPCWTITGCDLTTAYVYRSAGRVAMLLARDFSEDLDRATGMIQQCRACASTAKTICAYFLNDIRTRQIQIDFTAFEASHLQAIHHTKCTNEVSDGIAGNKRMTPLPPVGVQKSCSEDCDAFRSDVHAHFGPSPTRWE